MNKEILLTVCNTGIYSSSDEVGIVTYYSYIFENSTGNIKALRNSCEEMVCLSSV
jgi:hypothetical protein